MRTLKEVSLPQHQHSTCLFLKFEEGEKGQEEIESIINLSLTISFCDKNIFTEQNLGEYNGKISLSIKEGILYFKTKNCRVPINTKALETSDIPLEFDRSNNQFWIQSPGSEEDMEWRFYSYDYNKIIDENERAKLNTRLMGILSRNKWSKLKFNDPTQPSFVTIRFTVQADNMNVLKQSTLNDISDIHPNNVNIIKIKVLNQLLCQNEEGGYDLSQGEYKYE